MSPTREQRKLAARRREPERRVLMNYAMALAQIIEHLRTVPIHRGDWLRLSQIRTVIRLYQSVTKLAWWLLRGGHPRVLRELAAHVGINALIAADVAGALTPEDA